MRPFVILALLLATSPAQAFDILDPSTYFAPSSCELTSPEVKVTTSDTPVQVDVSHSSEDLDGMGRSMKGALREGWVTNGLTTAFLRTSVDSVTKVSKLSDGRWCAALVNVTFSADYESPIHVFISNRYAPGSCQYGAVYGHEMQHVGISKAILAADMDGAEARIQADIVGRGSFVAATQQQARDAAEAVANAEMLQLSDLITREAGARNAALDTESNYRRIESQCPQW